MFNKHLTCNKAILILERVRERETSAGTPTKIQAPDCSAACLMGDPAHCPSLGLSLPIC